MTSPDTLVLRAAGRPVARYVTRPELPARLSPRPYLHPVTTLAGTAVTELSPADHAHHLGVGVAVPDVEGHNFWGGRTFVRDQGPAELDNHGAQRHSAFQLRDPDGFVEEPRWVAAGAELLRERRTVSALGRRPRPAQAPERPHPAAARPALHGGGRAAAGHRRTRGALPVRLRRRGRPAPLRSRRRGHALALGRCPARPVRAPQGPGHAGAATFTRFRITSL
ncbi:DUF6807 family protein [Streptomyces sp. NPDC046942]|uniref:DUF6807 family protein n=1 Tax=Streptomyces sp. NPDC046942 TaxID=3155137 RepID=UPI0033EAE6C7